MASLPVLGTIDFKWFITGLVFAMFILPAIMRIMSAKRSGARKIV